MNRTRLAIMGLALAALDGATAHLAIAQNSSDETGIHGQFEKEAVVVVNGVPILKDYFHRRLRASSETGPTRDVKLISAIVLEELQFQFAKSKGLAATDEEVEQSLFKLSERRNLMDYLKRERMTLEDVKRQLRLRLSVNKTYSSGFDATDAEMRAFYTQNVNKDNPKAAFYTPDAIWVAVITTKTKQQGMKALSALKSISFREAAARYSVDKTKDVGGEIPGFYRGRTRVSKNKEFEDEIFRIPPGRTVGPIDRMGSWWIIRCLSKTPARWLEYENVMDECREGVMIEKGNARNRRAIEKEFAAFCRKARIESLVRRYDNAVQIRRE